jgi:CRP/FNR family transcriptional regulator, cyclic AMP receptor protein
VIAGKLATLRRHEFFRSVPEEITARLAAHAREVSFRPGQRIFNRGDEGHGLLAVLSGTVKISIQSERGQEIVLNLIGPNEVFGEIALLDGGTRTADATAVTRCQLVSLDRRDFVAVLTSEPLLAVKLLEVVSGRIRRTSQQVEDLTFADLPTRLARVLLRLAEVQGTAEGSARRLAITQQELGRMTGHSRESINRELRDWQERGLVALEKAACTLKNLEGLERIASAE